MICKKCGSTILGKYCCNCGKRARSEAEEEFLALQRSRNQFISEKFAERDYKLFGKKAADAAWALAAQIYTEKNGLPTRKNCRADAKFLIEQEAECIIRMLDAVHYRSQLN